jgi:LuxR family transcriptional regulator, maltose regulon positive regulatory protein
MTIMAPPTAPALVSRSKIERPTVSGQWVRRPRIEARLDRAFDRSLILISAPAGHGKTSTIACWLELRGHDAAWMTVDEHDADLTRFAAHVAATLDRVASGVADPRFALLTAPDRLGATFLGEAFAETLYDLERDVLLVLDDFHAAASESVSAFVGGLLSVAPRRLHTILSTRSKPALSLARLRTLGDVEELIGSDLRFSPEETGQLLRLETGESIDSALEASLQASVGGWPAAIRLIALSGASDALQRQELAFERQARLLGDYLGEEVLARLPPTHRDLLLWASLLDRFNAPLLEALATEQGGHPVGRDDVERLRALELFREIPGLSETWFAYHPLFRDVLRRELERTADAAAIAVRRRSIAYWFATAGLTLEAVQHLVALDDIPAATALIESRLSDAFAREDWQSVASWLRSVPMEAVRESPELLLASAWVAYLSGRDTRLADILEMMRGDEIWPCATPAQRAEIVLLTTIPEADPIEAIEVAEHAIAVIPPSNRYRYGYAHMALGVALTSAGRGQEALFRLAAFTDRESTRIDAASIRGYFARVLVLRQMGRLARCEQTAADQLQLAAMNDLPVSAGWGALFLGVIAHERGDLTAATGHISTVIADADRVHFICLREAFFVQILAYEALGRQVEADRAAVRLRELAIASETAQQLALVDSFLARTALVRGDLAAAQRWLEAATPFSTYEDLKAVEQPQLTRVKVLIAVGTPAALDEADRLIAEFVAFGSSRHMALALLEGLAVQALLYEAKGDCAAATRALEESLALAAQEGIVQRYAYLGPALAPLLRRLLAGRAAVPHARNVLGALEALLAAQPATRAFADLHQGLPETPLTARELEVVHLLALRLTNNEIGEELYISPITVKNHIANITEKLGVSGRRAAVDRAGELGLLRAAS